MRFIGLDAGSVSVKVVVLDEKGGKLEGRYVKHKGHPVEVSRTLLEEIGATDAAIAITGSSGRLIAEILGVEPINEIVAQSFSTNKLFPHIRTVIEMGGEDSKLIIMGGEGSAAAKDFSMNSVCAAGTGSFLDQQAERLLLTIEEFSQLALKSKKPPRIAGRCSVFAKSDMIHLQQIATPLEDIVAGLCFAVARNFKGTISRGRQVLEPVAFQGGVAANMGMARAFREVFGLKELFTPPDFSLMGAWGAALKTLEEKTVNRFDIRALEKFLEAEKNADRSSHSPLVVKDDDFFLRHPEGEGEILKELPPGSIRAYMGVDVGSISTNLAVIDERGRLLSKRYLMTSGRPIEAVRTGLAGIAEEIGDRVEIVGVGTTGSGRYMTADYVGADIVKNEITAQATAAAFIDKNVDTIFEIGGQDSKFISLRDGVIVDFEMNKACAAGTGSFLEEQAEKLSVSIKKEFAERAFSSNSPSRLGERCTVFMENSLMANLQRGTDKPNLLAGLAYSIVQNYINRVVAGKPVGENIFFQGGVAFNKSVVAAFEKYLGTKITVPPHHDVTGAIGMALIAKKHAEGQKGNGYKTTFKGFDLSKRGYELSSFECKGCPNICEINRVKIEGEKGYLLYGGRCEKYDINKKPKPEGIEDLFAFRENKLWGEKAPKDQKENDKLRGAADPSPSGVVDPAGPPPSKKNPRGAIGIPYIFYFHDYLPYWRAFLESLGFEVVISPKTNRQLVDIGLESVLSESCFPVKVALGHIRHLRDSGVDAIFIPSFMNLNREGEEYPRGLACPYTQTMPYVAKVSLEGLRLISPPIDMGRGRAHLVGILKKAFKEFGVGKKETGIALDAAGAAQAEFDSAVREKGREVIAGLDKRTIVIIGRSYNAFEKGMNLQIPEKLATLGVQAVPMDMLPLDSPLKESWPNMYWRSGQRILRAARYIAGHPRLYPLYIGNFSCGPDSFILKFFKEELKGKPFLHIEIDEHSADAGAITRCEAFLDSIENRKERPAPPARARAVPALSLKRQVFIPRMADHAFAVAGAFERFGVQARVLPESDRESVDIGMRYVSGKECYPCIVTTGDMVKTALSKDFRPAESAFFMPSGTGPCRFGQYNVFHRRVLDNLGLQEVPVFAPNQDVQFYRDLGIVGSGFTLLAWRGIVAIELLYKCLRETRPYEKSKGATEALYADYLKKIYSSVRSMNGRGDSLDDILVSMRRGFEGIEKTPGRRPLIGIIGEIYVRCHRFSNEDLVKKIESLGGEVWLAPFEEWIYYVNLMGLRKALIKKDRSAMLDSIIKRFFQRRVEHKFGKHFKGYLKTLEEPSTREILKKAAPYVHDSFEGETILSIGKAVDLVERGASGIINAMPFGCMPGTIVTALMRGISRDYDIPAISIPYDGTESPTTAIQLEAFMDQAKNRMTNAKITAKSTKGP